MKRLSVLLALFVWFACISLSANLPPLTSTESDPDAVIHGCVNVIDGCYCEVATDLVIAGPDALTLQRFYRREGWSLFPQRFLVMGRDPSGDAHQVLALTGERSGGILPYSGRITADGTITVPLEVNGRNRTSEMVNTYAKEINGQNNHRNNLLYCCGEMCKLILGDGSHRIYQRVTALPSLILGEEMTSEMLSAVEKGVAYRLISEILPSGNCLLFSYGDEGHLTSVVLKNPSQTQTLSWIRFYYDLNGDGGSVRIATSDERELIYRYAWNAGVYQLVGVGGSHCIPNTYKYNDRDLVRKQLLEGQFLEVNYSDGKVHEIRGAHHFSGESDILYSFSYGENYTDRYDAEGVQTRIHYDTRHRLTAVEVFDEQGQLYRTERKYWGEDQHNVGWLLAKTVEDASKHIHSYRCFTYDVAGNILEERLYGNLTGKGKASLKVSSEGVLLDADAEECHIKSFGYSTDGFNLLTQIGDSKGNQTRYIYQPGTNLLQKVLICDKGQIKKRTFREYDETGVCKGIIHDDGCTEEVSNLTGVTERQIRKIRAKKSLPGVGLAEEIDERVLDLKTGEELLLKRSLLSYDPQGNLIVCDTYDSVGNYAFTESRNYTPIGRLATQIDALGRETLFSYDEIGREVARVLTWEGKSIETIYDFHNHPIRITECCGGEERVTYHLYDRLGRKVGTTDRFGETTRYDYDAFHRLTQVTHPEVLDETEKRIRPAFSYVYDIFGNVIATTDPQGYVTEKSYTLRGNPTHITYPDGSYELFKYDPEGSLHRSLTRDQIITI